LAEKVKLIASLHHQLEASYETSAALSEAHAVMKKEVEGTHNVSRSVLVKAEEEIVRLSSESERVRNNHELETETANHLLSSTIEKYELAFKTNDKTSNDLIESLKLENMLLKNENNDIKHEITSKTNELSKVRDMYDILKGEHDITKTQLSDSSVKRGEFGACPQ
jgi:hypothetical protein